MATTSAPTIKRSQNDPDLMFTEDILADPSVAPQLFDNSRVPNLRVYGKGEGPGNPDIVTARTDVYILGWEDKDPNDPFYRDAPDAPNE